MARIDRKKFVIALMDADLKLIDLAKKSGLSRSTITAVKGGKSCSKRTADTIARALGVDVTEIIEE